MFSNHVLASLRSFLKNKNSFIINFMGLVLAFLSVLVIGTYVLHELTYDQFHEKADRIFRVTHNEKNAEIPGHRHLATVGPPVGPALKQTFGQIENAVRLRFTPDHILRYKETQNYESHIFYADPSIFDVFTFPLKAGDPGTALSSLNSVVLTEPMAKKYFGDEDPLGQIITMDNLTELKVTGVLAPIPDHSHIKFDFLLPFEAFKVPFGYPVTLDDWGWISFHTYILLKPGADAKQLQAQLPELINKHWPPERTKKFRMELQSLNDIYLGDVFSEQNTNGNRNYLIVLSVAGFMILLVAGFNYANLFTAISITRGKEMGVRKVIGASRKSIARHLLMESMIVCVIAGVTAMVIAPAFLSLLNMYGIPPLKSATSSLLYGALFVLTSIIIGLVAAIYPSILLSALDHGKLLRGSFKMSPAGLVMRKGFVFAQFIVSITLVASVFIVMKQVDFLKHKDLGFVKDELMVLRVPEHDLALKFSVLKNQLAQNTNVVSVSMGGGRLDGDNGDVPIYAEGHADGIPMAIDAAPFDFLRTIGVKVLAGREISEKMPSDSLRGVLINEAAARTFGWSNDQALGKKIRIGEIMEGEVIGVMPDFHYTSLRHTINPLVMSYPRTHLQDVYVRFSTHDVSALTESISKDWSTVFQDLPLDFVFLNDHLQNQYKAEQFFRMLFQFFGVIAIVIACLGLYGLISQETINRIREIGIRKVLGASPGKLLVLILKPFMVLVIAANAVAWPLSWWGMEQWLKEFSYHLAMPWIAFPLAGLVTFLIAFMTIFYKTISAVRRNPAEVLRMD